MLDERDENNECGGDELMSFVFGWYGCNGMCEWTCLQLGAFASWQKRLQRQSWLTSFDKGWHRVRMHRRAFAKPSQAQNLATALRRGGCATDPQAGVSNLGDERALGAKGGEILFVTCLP